MKTGSLVRERIGFPTSLPAVLRKLKMHFGLAPDIICSALGRHAHDVILLQEKRTFLNETDLNLEKKCCILQK